MTLHALLLLLLLLPPLPHPSAWLAAWMPGWMAAQAPMHKALLKAVGRSPSLDLRSVPLLQRLLASGAPGQRHEEAWVLQLIRWGIRVGGARVSQRLRGCPPWLRARVWAWALTLDLAPTLGLPTRDRPQCSLAVATRWAQPQSCV